MVISYTNQGRAIKKKSNVYICIRALQVNYDDSQHNEGELHRFLDAPRSMLTSTKMSICERGYREVRMAVSNVCWRCMLISWDFRSPRGRRLRSPVLKVAMLYWQFTTTLSCNALPRPPVTCTHSVTGYFTDTSPPCHIMPFPFRLSVSPVHIWQLVTSLKLYHHHVM